MNRNKEIEESYFKRFTKELSFDFLSVEHDDKPDFIVKYNSINIGIELTNCFTQPNLNNKSSEQQQDVLKEIVIKKAQSEYIKNGGNPKIEVTIGFNLKRPIKKTDQLAQSIVKFLLPLNTKTSRSLPPSSFDKISEVSFIYINSTEYDDAIWRVSRVYVPDYIKTQRINEIIIDKEKKLKNYKECDEYWLLIVLEYMDPAQDQIIPKNFQPDLITNSFSKIFLFQTTYNNVFLLQNNNSSF